MENLEKNHIKDEVIKEMYDEYNYLRLKEDEYLVQIKNRKNDIYVIKDIDDMIDEILYDCALYNINNLNERNDVIKQMIKDAHYIDEYENKNLYQDLISVNCENYKEREEKINEIFEENKKNFTYDYEFDRLKFEINTLISNDIVGKFICFNEYGNFTAEKKLINLVKSHINYSETYLNVYDNDEISEDYKLIEVYLGLFINNLDDELDKRLGIKIK